MSVYFLCLGNFEAFLKINLSHGHLARSINTSLTTLLALVVLYFVGGESTQHFSLALIIGIAVGTYSSVFLGSPLLVTIWKYQENKKIKEKAKK